MKKFRNVYLILIMIFAALLLVGCKNGEKISEEENELIQIKEKFKKEKLVTYQNDDTKDSVTSDIILLDKFDEYKIHWSVDGDGAKLKNNMVIITRTALDQTATLKATILVTSTISITEEIKITILKVIIEKTKYLVSFDTDEGTPSLEPQEVTEGESVLEEPQVTKEGYTLLGWYDGDTKVSFPYFPTKDVMLTAKWSNLKTFSLTLPENVTANVSNLESIFEGTDVTLTVSNPDNQEYLIFINNQFASYDENGEYEFELNQNTTVTAELKRKTTPIFDARKIVPDLPTSTAILKGIITGIVPDRNANYYYLNDGTAAIIIRTSAYPELRVGDLILSEGAIGNYFNNLVFYPHDNNIVVKSNQELPPPVYVNNVSKGTLDYDNLSLQAKRFDVDNLILKEKITAGKDLNFDVEDSFGNIVEIRFHRYLSDELGDQLYAKVKDLEIGDIIHLRGAHLTQYQYKNDPYIIQFMISGVDEILIGESKPRQIVSFNLNNGEPNISFSIVEGQKIPLELIPRPIKSGHKFNGWYLGASKFDFETLINEPITLTAAWVASSDPDDPVNPYDPSNQAVIDNLKDPVVIKYYQNINFNASNSSLHTNLKSLVYARELGYDSAKSWLLDADRDLKNPDKLRGIYDQVLFNRRWDSAATWNREHVWPQSKLGSAGKGEAHNLRVSGVRINSSRGNMPFSENASSTGTLGYSLGSYWWPGSIDKGDVARILLFMYLRHGLRLDNSSGGMGQIKVLFKWHKEDPVDAFEIQRNNVIHRAQGNRNPFIDHPESFEKIWNHANGIISAAADMQEVFVNTTLQYQKNTTTLNTTFFKES